MNQLITTLSLFLLLTSYANAQDSRQASEQCYQAANQALRTIESAYWSGRWGDDFVEQSDRLFAQVCNNHCSEAVFRNGQSVNCSAVRSDIASRSSALGRRSAARGYLDSLQRISFSIEQGRALGEQEFYEIRDGVINPDELYQNDNQPVAL